MKRILSLTIYFFIAFLSSQTNAQSRLYVKTGYSAINNRLFTHQRFNDSCVSDSNLTVIGRWPYGTCKTVFIKGDYAYVENGAVMSIIDVSEPISPVQVGEIETPGVVEDIHVDGIYAYIADGYGGLRIINVSDPSSPVEVNFYNTGDYTEKVYVLSQRAYISTYDTYYRSYEILILNVSAPTAPELIRHIPMDERVFDIDAKIISWRSYLFLANSSDGFRVFDVTDAEVPVEVDRIDNVSQITSIDIIDDYAYVVGYYYLYIIDIKNPKDIKLISTLRCGHGIYEIAVSDGYAFITDIYYSGIWIIDVRQPDSPNIVTYFVGDIMGSGCDVQVKDQYVYLASGSDGLQILDVSMPENPIEVSSFDTGGFYTDVIVLNDYAYIIGGASLHIFDLSIPGQPKELGSIRIDGGYTTDIYVAGDYAYFVCKDGLWIIDVSNPYKPLVVGVYNTENVAWSVYVEGNYVYLGCRDGLHVFDVSIKSDPKEISFIDTEDLVRDVYISNNYAYLAIESGIQIFNISIPSSPIRVGNINITQESWIDDIYVSGTYAYLAAFSDGLIIVDVSRPEAPVEVGSYDEGFNFARDVYVSDNFAYITDGMNGMRIIDVNKPGFPFEVSCFLTHTYGLFVSGNLAYVTCGYGGFYILRNDLSTADQSKPEYISLKQNYPNPFISETTISFELPIPKHVTLTIYDINGREVKKLTNAVLYNSGAHEIKINSKNLTSGVYFYRIQAGDFIETRKFVLVK